MNIDPPAAAAKPVGDGPSPLPSAVRGRIILYVSMLVVLLGFGSPFGGLIDVPVSFLLKNKLHLTAQEVSTFRLVAAIPLYCSFVFGFARDTWNPFGRGDRGFLILFGTIAAGTYLFFAFTPPTYFTLLAAVVLSTTAFLFVASAQLGMTSTLGQQHAMTGEMSATLNLVSGIPLLGAFILGGVLSDRFEGQGADHATRVLFLVGAAIMAALAGYGLWKPRTVFDNIRAERGPVARPWQDVKRLLRHWPIYPALAIWLLWQFGPGSQTPLQYYLQNSLHATDAQWGQWNAINNAFFMPTFLLYGFLCQKISLRILLFFGTIVAVPQLVPLLFIHSMTGALIAAAIIGLLGGVANAAYFDLIIRSCPKGLQGTTLMLASSLFYLSTRFGDLLGTTLYDRFGGFAVCVIATTVVYALIMPILFLVPKRLIMTSDGESLAEEI
jgi:MFS family permease